MGAAFILQRARGMDPMQSGIGPLILINLALGFVIPNVSVGGHVGGLLAGCAAALLVEEVGKRRGSEVLAVAACVLVAVIAVAGRSRWRATPPASSPRRASRPRAEACDDAVHQLLGALAQSRGPGT
jgi:hypothetical protein